MVQITAAQKKRMLEIDSFTEFQIVCKEIKLSYRRIANNQFSTNATARGFSFECTRWLNSGNDMPCCSASSRTRSQRSDTLTPCSAART